MTNSDATDPEKSTPKSENKKSNNTGTRASQLVKKMEFREQIDAIRKEWKQYEESGKKALEALKAIGGYLNEVHEWLDDYNDTTSKERGIAWEDWCKTNLPFGKRQANRYIRIWENRKKLKFSENETVSVRAALCMISGSGGGKTKALRSVGKGKSNIKSKIEAGPTGGVSAGATGHQIRLTWRDDEMGKSLCRKGEKAVAPDESDMLATACARLFSFTLNSKNGELGKRVCNVIGRLPSAPRDAAALAATIQRMESALMAPANIGGPGIPGETGLTGLTGPMG